MTIRQDGRIDALIIGAGIAGLTAALELAKQQKQVVILDNQDESQVGGLARSAFGGMALVGTPEQKRNGIKDSAEIALEDWYSFANFSDDDKYPRQWAKHYVERSYEDVYCYVKNLGVKFLPAVNWVERGLYSGGNSLPRYHVMWGTSLELVDKVMAAIAPYIDTYVHFKFNHHVDSLLIDENRVVGCCARPIQMGNFNIKANANSSTITDTNKKHDNAALNFYAKHTIVAGGGFTGNLDMVKQHWPRTWSKPPKTLLNGTHPGSDGAMHDEVAKYGGHLTHMDKMWNYAAGIPHPQPKFSGHGLSLIPCKSALWLDADGKRIGPNPLVTGFDTNYLCQRMAEQEQGYAWQVLNWKIASKEFAISGAEHNIMIRDKKFFSFLKETLLGNHRLVKQMQTESDHFIVANSVAELTKKMNAIAAENPIEQTILQQTLDDYDQILARPESQWNDDQIRRIEHARKWKADKLRTCKPHPIQDSKHGPLIAIKVVLISRKSLGGIQTNLDSQVLDNNEQCINGLFAIGEAAGFGGGGASGAKSLEGTFLSGCILTAQQAARFINKG
ncbi:FAD-binding dehydrogenase [Thalassotalea sp. ND16A]|uniref:FAD-binding dehydrogenase n=1 Tax=Thalassotalea sp. ND16A TaxID=1535422 RepID=UPI00051A23A8|nr:FAD-binding dehydrogenase [Thalassotalea sp. ND16A]KGJ99615.1 hypothetical protein ND16A_3715 [Thalassotalea sp. ND16A]